METQNVSAQIYFKQLPEDPMAGKFGCNETGPNLSTCVNDEKTDTNIEGAFQSQLDLSEYYKSPGVFNTMKKTFMDKTMEGANTPIEQEVSENIPQPKIITPKIVPSGPVLPTKSSFTSKSNFGSSGNNLVLYAIIAIILLMLFIYLKN
jgi:hypothetical protein